MKELTLREVCDKYHVTRRAIQGYEKSGLVSATRKNKYGYLLYDETTQNRIAKVKQYQDMGFQIKEIVHIIDASDTDVKIALIKRKTSLEQDVLHTKHMIELINNIIQELS